MKFWELVWAFRDEKDILETVLSNPKWKSYQISYQNLDVLVAEQNRYILDEEIPYELALEVCCKSHKQYWFYPNRMFQILCGFRWDLNEPVEILNVEEVLNRFGGHIIEEVFEKSYTECYNPKKTGSLH